MSVERIDHSLCSGCGTCVDACPMDVLRIDPEAEKAIIVYAEDCTLCALCEVVCPARAIYVSPSRDVPMPTCWGM